MWALSFSVVCLVDDELAVVKLIVTCLDNSVKLNPGPDQLEGKPTKIDLLTDDRFLTCVWG